MLIVILLAVSVSFDTLGVAMAYAIGGIVIPRKTRLLIALLNGVLTAAAIWLGRLLCAGVPEWLFQILGAAILITLGVKTLWNALGDNKTADYDKDASRSIDLCEGCVVGVVFALDSISAALGILNLGETVYLFPVCTAVLCYVFLLFGGKSPYNLRRLNGVSGIILIAFGLLRLYSGLF